MRVVVAIAALEVVVGERVMVNVAVLVLKLAVEDGESAVDRDECVDAVTVVVVFSGLEAACLSFCTHECTSAASRTRNEAPASSR